MDTRLSLEVVQCRQFDPVSGPFSMNNERKDETSSVYTVGSQNNLVPVKSRYAYFKRRSQVSSLLVIILVFLVASLFIVVLVLSILYAMAGHNKEICNSEACMRIAASFKESMDTTVDPCDDFYKYTCGRWPEEHPIPESSFTNSWFSERAHLVSRKIRDLLNANISEEDVPWSVMQAKILYTSCLDVQAMDDLGLLPLFDLLEQVKIPIIPAAFTKQKGDFIEQMAMVKRVLAKDVFVGLEIIPDPRNKSVNVIILDVPEKTRTLPSDQEIEKRLQSIRSRVRKLENEPMEEEEDPEEVAELTYMIEVIREVVSNGTVDICSLNDENTFPKEEDLNSVIENLYDISNTVYYVIQSTRNRSVSEDSLSDSHYMLVDDLQNQTDEYVVKANSTLTPKLIWRPFLEKLFKGIINVDLDGRDKILVSNLQYLKIISYVLSIVDDENLETYIWWSVIDTVTPYSSENLRKSWSKYINKLMSVEVGSSRSLKCASAVNELMGMAVSWLFADPNFHKTKGPKVFEMLGDIRAAFASLVRDNDWMDERTKKATLEKNNKMSSEISHPEWLFEEGELDEYYDGIDLTETNYLDNMVQVISLMSSAELECLHEMNYDDETYWATDPTDVNAFHTFQDNQITIPAGILQFPFYELGLEVLNYGAIGTVLGHELTHGFDNSGRKYDGNGNLRQWWTNETIYEYTDKTECFINHYNSYYEDEVEDYVDGELTLGENIADNGGLREAVIAYERWKARHGQEPLLPGFTHLTHEQLLFLSYAHLWCEAYTATSLRWMLEDSHCPGHVRLRAVLRNSKEFSKAWECPVGSNMNPREKCRVW